MAIETTTLTIRIPKDLKHKVAKAAKADYRSLTSYIIKVLRAATAVDLFDFDPVPCAAPEEMKRRVIGSKKRLAETVRPKVRR